MTLLFSALDDRSCQQDFSCDLPELEDVFDILNVIAYQGNTILKAQIIDEGTRTELPCEVFDGKPLSASLKKLEKQWQAVLSKPVRSSALVSRRWLLAITRHRISLYDNQIAHCTTLVSRLDELRQRALAGREGYHRISLIRHYDSLIDRYKQYIDRTVADRDCVREKLNQLEHIL